MKNLKKTKLTRQFVSHFNLKKCSLTKYRLETDCGLIFYQESEVEKLGFMEYGKTSCIFYFPFEKIYKSIKWCLKSKGLYFDENK